MLMLLNKLSENTTKNRTLIIIISVILFMAACFTPAILFIHDDNTCHGYDILLTGWIGIILGLPTWYANIAYLFVLLTLLSNLLNVCLFFNSIMVLLMASIILLFYPIFPADEGGSNYLIIKHFEIGAYFWFASLLLPLVWLINYKIRK